MKLFKVNKIGLKFGIVCNYIFIMANKQRILNI